MAVYLKDSFTSDLDRSSITAPDIWLIKANRAELWAKRVVD